MKTSRYSLDRDPVPDFAALCRRFAGKPTQSPFRSTVPLLSLVEHSRADWDSLLALWEAPPEAPVSFEYRIALPKPGGNPSQTDAMVLWDRSVLAIEAKWTESRYETVAKRIGKPESDGGDPKVTVAGWLQRLQPFASRPLEVNDVADVVYQMIHRAASACAVATRQGRQPHLVYLHFHPSPDRRSAATARYVADLRDLHTAMGGPTDLSFTVVEMPLNPTPAFKAIENLDKRSRATSAKVLEALRQGALFTFGKPDITRI